MLDIKLIRSHFQEIEEKVKRKDPEISLSPILSLDEEIRKLKLHVETLKAERNEGSKKIGEIKRQGGDPQKILEKVSGYAEEIHESDKRINELEEEFEDFLSRIPNIPFDEVRVSQDPADNVVIKEWGKKPEFSFAPKNHVELNEALGLFDFSTGARISGKGWVVYKNLGARLEWALLNYMMEIQQKHGFEQVMIPLLVRPEAMYGSAQLPKFESQLFKIKDEDYHLYLIPTSEVALNGLHADQILDEEDLWKFYYCYSPCFRREAGAAGSQERGLIRVHQFNKVEMFCFCKPEDSMKAHQKMVDVAEEILQGLNIHYRNVLLVTGDTSFPSAYTVDVEVWLPGQDRYYEVSSISNCTDFQARRSNIRFRRKGEKPEFVHTLNGSGLATSRLMVGLLEANQNEDGSITIPEVLRDRMGMERIELS
ncbi:MAG: serine--tRNA ligase [Chlamydiales bacterium]